MRLATTDPVCRNPAHRGSPNPEFFRGNLRNGTSVGMPSRLAARIISRWHSAPVLVCHGFTTPSAMDNDKSGQCQAVVDRDNSAEATTLQTGTNWVVKTEQRRRRIAILDIACGAVKLATEPLWGGPVGVNRQVAFTELISLLDRGLKKKPARFRLAKRTRSCTTDRAVRFRLPSAWPPHLPAALPVGYRAGVSPPGREFAGSPVCQ